MTGKEIIQDWQSIRLDVFVRRLLELPAYDHNDALVAYEAAGKLLNLK